MITSNIQVLNKNVKYYDRKIKNKHIIYYDHKKLDYSDGRFGRFFILKSTNEYRSTGLFYKIYLLEIIFNRNHNFSFVNMTNFYVFKIIKIMQYDILQKEQQQQVPVVWCTES